MANTKNVSKKTKPNTKKVRYMKMGKADVSYIWNREEGALH
jgi:hypothetical protein